MALIASTYVFDSYDTSVSISDEFKIEALFALCGDGSFTCDGERYTIREEDEQFSIVDSSGTETAVLSTYSIRRYSGQDTLDLDFKDAVRVVVEDMLDSGAQTASFVHSLPAMDEEANYVYDEDGNLTYTDTELTVTRTTTQFVISCEQTTYLIDIHAAPSSEHWLGTDGDGMDILARAMYGGRISLMVGFVVVLLEMFLGIIMGGIAGFFGGWVDTF
ncbi:MAG: hypothetical protein Q4C13_05915, partial [Clostridia bacterium]|nr:hypothetical protein [Clostridia bacterium]